MSESQAPRFILIWSFESMDLENRINNSTICGHFGGIGSEEGSTGILQKQKHEPKTSSFHPSTIFFDSLKQLFKSERYNVDYKVHCHRFTFKSNHSLCQIQQLSVHAILYAVQFVHDLPTILTGSR